jgi:molecular chaperone DnaK (HSP70)
MKKTIGRRTILVSIGTLLLAVAVYHGFNQIRQTQAALHHAASIAQATYTGHSGKFLGESVEIEADGGGVARFLVKGMELPAFATAVFSTSKDNQPTLDLHVLAGDEVVADNNRSLGRFSAPLTPAAKGIPRLEVTIAAAADGTVTISSKERSGSAAGSATLGRIHLQ